MFAYSCSINICASGFDELLESIFCILLVVEAFSLQKVVKILEEVVVGWRQANMVDEAKLHIPVYSPFDMVVVQYTTGTVVEKNWAFLLTSAGYRHCRYQLAEHTSQI